MFWKQKRKIDKSENGDLLQKIKSEIETQLEKRGVAVTGINMQINSNMISLSIYITR